MDVGKGKRNIGAMGENIKKESKIFFNPPSLYSSTLEIFTSVVTIVVIRNPRIKHRMRVLFSHKPQGIISTIAIITTMAAIINI